MKQEQQMQSNLELGQINMFDMTTAELKEMVETSPTFKFDGPAMLAMSMISDAQTEMSMGETVYARRTMNRAKWILVEYLQKPRD